MKIKEIRPAPVILGVVIVFLAALSVRVEDTILRLRISDVAIFLSVLFFHFLLKEDIGELERRVKKLEEWV